MRIRPGLIANIIRKRAPAARRIVFETGPLSVWFYHALRDEGVPAICIDARHAKAALDMAPNKTDANDADGLAHLAEVGFYPRGARQRVRQHACPHAGGGANSDWSGSRLSFPTRSEA